MEKKEKKILEVLKNDEITTDELQQLLIIHKKNTTFLLIDVREQEEYNIEKIVGVDLLVPTL